MKAKSLTILLALLPLLTPAAAKTSAHQSKHTKHLGHAKAAGVRLTGLTPHQARARLHAKLASRLDVPVYLTDGAKRVKLHRRKLGIRVNTTKMVARVKGRGTSPVAFTVDEAVARKELRRITPLFASHGENASVYEYHGAVHVNPGRDARHLNVDASARRIAEEIAKNPRARTLRVVISKSPPTVPASAFKGIDGRLSRFSTHFNTARVKRTKNMRLAIGRIDGTIVKPGGIFSLNDTVGPRNHAYGYRTAIIFQNGQLKEDIGGGVSQVTGTLFNAALLADLPIVTYKTHSRPVHYLPVGRDATVSWGNFDMKFKNNTGYPVLIRYSLSGNTATATIYGHKTSGRTVRLSVHSVKLGPRHITAALYRVVKERGKVAQREKIGRSDYQWKPGWTG